MTTIPGVIHWGDLPVPYVAAWSSETRAFVQRDRLIENRPAIHRTGGRGDGRPLFGKMDERRTRRVVIEKRCQVCACELRGVGFVIDVPYARTGGGFPLMHEPPSCERCFKIAILMCPGIARMAGRPRLLAARVRHFEAFAVTVGIVDENGTPEINEALKAWRGPTPVVGYVRAALVDYDVLSSRELLTVHTAAGVAGEAS